MENRSRSEQVRGFQYWAAADKLTVVKKMRISAMRHGRVITDKLFTKFPIYYGHDHNYSLCFSDRPNFKRVYGRITLNKRGLPSVDSFDPIDGIFIRDIRTESLRTRGHFQVGDLCIWLALNDKLEEIELEAEPAAV
jgi:hypothetical protein